MLYVLLYEHVLPFSILASTFNLTPEHAQHLTMVWTDTSYGACSQQLLTGFNAGVHHFHDWHVGFPPPTANGLPGPRPPGPRMPAFGVRPPGAAAVAAPPMRPPQLGGAPPPGSFQPNQQPPGPGFPPQQQTLGRPGLTPPGKSLLSVLKSATEHCQHSLCPVSFMKQYTTQCLSPCQLSHSISHLPLRLHGRRCKLIDST